MEFEMKKDGLRSVWILIGLTACLFSGCGQQKQDRNIKADIATKARTDLNFAGVSYMVADGIVSLTGKCPTQKAKDEVEKTVRDISIVKDIVSTIEIAPVILGADQALKESVDSVLMHYARVQAVVMDSTVLVRGVVEQKDLQELMSGLQSLQPRKLDNQLTVQ
jgi:osmotically-inducible protein OsmY